MSNDQHLLFAFDENYAFPGLVAIQTALTHSPSSVHLAVASVGLTPKTVAEIHRAAQRHGREVSVVDVENMIRGLPRGLARFSSAAWARIFVDRIVHADAQRIVYLDADTLCRGPIAELFEIDLGGAPLAAVPDALEPTHELRGLEYWTAVSSAPTAEYFNSGVMVIDRSTWVADDVTGKALRLIAEGSVPTRSVDQDVLNAVLWNRWVPISDVWNTQGTACGSVDAARIVHFVGDRKPWQAGRCGGPFEDEYRRKAAEFGWSR